MRRAWTSGGNGSSREGVVVAWMEEEEVVVLVWETEGEEFHHSPNSEDNDKLGFHGGVMF